MQLRAHVVNRITSLRMPCYLECIAHTIACLATLCWSTLCTAAIMASATQTAINDMKNRISSPKKLYLKRQTTVTSAAQLILQRLLGTISYRIPFSFFHRSLSNCPFVEVLRVAIILAGVAISCFTSPRTTALEPPYFQLHFTQNCSAICWSKTVSFQVLTTAMSEIWFSLLYR